MANFLKDVEGDLKIWGLIFTLVVILMFVFGYIKHNNEYLYKKAELKFKQDSIKLEIKKLTIN